MSKSSTEEFYTGLPIIGGFMKWLGESDFDYGPIAGLVAFSLIILSLAVFGVSTGQVLTIFFALTPIWLPYILFILFFKKWMDTVGTKFYLNQGRTTLRIKLPQEVMKSPEAMEFVIAQIHNTANPDNLMQTYLDGKRPLTFSFEIASIGGEVRFYVNVPTKKTRNAFEANMYAQYPGIEIVEEPVDYAAEVPLDYQENSDFEVFAAHMGKKKDGHLPIKSFIDYGLDKMPKEEEKQDPITPTLEVMAGIKPYERLYVQIIAISFRKDSFLNGQLISGEGPNWNEASDKEINKIMLRDPKTKGPIKDAGKEADFDGMPRITPGERSLIELLERHKGRYAYNVGIRWIYVTKKGKFDGDLINPVIRMFSQYDGANQIGVRWRTDFDYKNLIPGGKLAAINALKRQELKEFKLRKYFPKGSADNYKIFTSEELATMFHLPGKVALTPTLERIPSTRAEAPPNLPTGEFNQ